MPEVEKVDELDIVLRTIAAAKAAAIASVNALVAVEILLTPPVEPAPEPAPDEHADHGEKIAFETMAGRFLLCPCGAQWVAASEESHTSD